ncbi:MAG: butyrate kinase, partial [Chloroflexi bacterium]|nr:butyrate kinase [Chloroflexota bacterium]
LMAAELMQEHGVAGYCTDPVCVDEMEEVARLSGLPELERHSLSHALSMKSAARRAAAELGRRYGDLKLVVVHLGGGISVSAHLLGRMIDVNNANDQGPFSPERVGTLPLTGLLELIQSTPPAALRRRFWGGGGLVAHLGTNDGQEVERRIAAGDEKARLVYQAMAYQVCKEIRRHGGGPGGAAGCHRPHRRARPLGPLRGLDCREGLLPGAPPGVPGWRGDGCPRGRSAAGAAWRGAGEEIRRVD